MSDTLRAAAQQALEALDEFMADYQSDDGMNSMKHYAKQHHAAITTLRAALAEPTVKDSLTVASDTLPPLPERLRTYSADPELSDRYSDAMQEAADEIERLQAGIRELVAASGAETMGAAAVAEPVPSGFKMVPVEPTPEMAKAGCYRYCAAFVKDYKAMLSAAPAAPPQREPLTDADIDAACAGIECSNVDLGVYDRLIARAIERAHGISAPKEQ